jgi:LmbE family N-acetylglucosaminyl deacetylase
MSVVQSPSSTPFNPARPGTLESVWAMALRDALALEVPHGAVLVVSPHPDDEVLGAGGLIHAAVQSGRHVNVLSVTNGEAAYPNWKGLASIRRREVSDALNVLAPHAVGHDFLGIPDGQVDAHQGTLFDAIDQRLSFDTLLVAPYEHDGHPDHDATGVVCCEVARLRNATLWRYPIWSWHHRSPQHFSDKRWGRYRLDSGALAAKKRAMACFASQLQPWGREPIVPAHVLDYFTRSYEAFLL